MADIRRSSHLTTGWLADRSLLPSSAVVVGVQRGVLALEAYEPD